MLPNFFNNTKIPTPERSGVHNEFVAPISEDNSPKKDKVRITLVFLLIIVIVLSFLSFVYVDVLASQVRNKESQLYMYDSSQEVLTFNTNQKDIISLSQKLKMLSSVNENKVYISSIVFPILESVTESDLNSYVYFNNFDLKKESNSSIVEISLSGVAKDYMSLYKQLDNFKNGYFSSFFSNFKLGSISIDGNGAIIFDISFNMDISYKNLIIYVNKLNMNNKVNNLKN